MEGENGGCGVGFGWCVVYESEVWCGCFEEGKEEECGVLGCIY